MKELNLCKILKGHEGETFYSTVYGDVTLVKINEDCNTDSYPILIRTKNDIISNVTKSGKHLDSYSGECTLFPSKPQRNWNKWDKEHNPKVPKTWNEYKEKCECCKTLGCYASTNEMLDGTETGTNIERAAQALLKINLLIKAGYGGNITKEDWDNNKVTKWVIQYTPRGLNNIQLYYSYAAFSHLAFYSKEQAEEFLSYPDNVKLVKNYLMIN